MKHNCRMKKRYRFTCFEEHLLVETFEFERGNMVAKKQARLTESDVAAIAAMEDTHLGLKVEELWDDRLDHIRESSNVEGRKCCE